ncbi:hypothetical protein IMCC3088_568 [Aequoribacter fuscus]|jgi:hypothetical protein|uniref:Uncharacterized protein n=1 Tax=Aequoribacter fuscus TaxID=2518989 RepID=F3L5Y9_9GAMM|nr:hypothetical protein IMCC3088_568 [Aequoribacter fuscus]
MTQRTEFQERVLEVKSVLMAWIASRIFSFKQTGLDGWIKRRMLPKSKTRDDALST